VGFLPTVLVTSLPIPLSAIELVSPIIPQLCQSFFPYWFPEPVPPPVFSSPTFLCASPSDHRYATPFLWSPFFWMGFVWWALADFLSSCTDFSVDDPPPDELFFALIDFTGKRPQPGILLLTSSVTIVFRGSPFFLTAIALS